MMSTKKDNSVSLQDDKKKIRVSKNGPYIVSGRVPLLIKEIRNDEEGNCSTWRDVTTFPLKEQYSLCRCGDSKNKPFCDGTHSKIRFDGTETADDQQYLDHAEKIDGPALSLTDADNMCVHARFCMRGAGSGTLLGIQIYLRRGTLQLKKRETVPPGVWLSGTERPEKHLNPNLKNPSWL